MPGVDHRRSRSPSRRSDDRYGRRDYYRRERRYDDRRRSRSRRRDEPRSRKPSRSVSPPRDDLERDRKTVFVQQLAARLRTRQLREFFERAGTVYEASIVKDKITNRSKGVAYVEFEDRASVAKAINMTGEKLLGIPVIVQYTEAEKNRQAQEAQVAAQEAAGPAAHRIYVGNVYFGMTDNELTEVFKPFGEIEYVNLQRDPDGRSKGYAFVQYKTKQAADEAIEKMHGFVLAGRPLRIGRGGGGSFTPLPPQPRGEDRPSSSTNDRAPVSKTNASTLDDADSGISYSRVSRTHLMEKLMRDEDTDKTQPQEKSPQPTPPPASSTPKPPSRCILLNHMFDPSQ